LILGKHSGRHAFLKRVIDLGYKLENKKFKALFKKFKVLADTKKTVFDEDIVALLKEDTNSSNKFRQKIFYFGFI
jgi:2-isopropylmalate synthase